MRDSGFDDLVTRRGLRAYVWGVADSIPVATPIPIPLDPMRYYLPFTFKLL